MQYDLVLKGGKIIDKSQGLSGKFDIAFAKGKIAAIEADIPAEQSAQVINVTGKLVTPGLIDIHAHVFTDCTNLGIAVDDICPRTGVTTLVDAGSAGWVTLPGFRKYIIEPAVTRVLCLVHISTLGLIYSGIGEMLNIDYANPETTAQAVMGNRDVAIGVKVRQGQSIVGGNGFEPLHRAVKAAEMSNTFVMVHIGSMPGPLPEALKLLRSGDIITHCFHGRQTGVLDENGKLLHEVRAARREGIIFDIGHGAGSFSFKTARVALDSDFPPDVISSDLHGGSINGPVFDMPTTLSKFLYLGMPLEDVIEKATAAPAKVIGREELGTFKIGTTGDVAVFELAEGEFELRDAERNTVIANQRLMPVLTIKGGKVIGERV
ncbi:amidohydrolase/deacetylase family metallohydrolase [Candidatus Poribacteria bacterium]|nr:amidohydrolase/deacetylase family metallohydrolase [Candidatus Poribacteria bacterium]